MQTKRQPVSKGYKLTKGSLLLNKNGSKNPEFWSRKKATFSFIQSSNLNRTMGVFRCRQNGEIVERKMKKA